MHTPSYTCNTEHGEAHSNPALARRSLPAPSHLTSLRMAMLRMAPICHASSYALRCWVTDQRALGSISSLISGPALRNVDCHGCGLPGSQRCCVETSTAEDRLQTSSLSVARPGPQGPSHLPRPRPPSHVL